jgi:hypothetical protein
LAVVAVCSDTVHLKSVQVLGVGISCADVHVPSIELFPAAVGDVSELSRSKPVHPAAADAAIDNTTRRIRFFIL